MKIALEAGAIKSQDNILTSKRLQTLNTNQQSSNFFFFSNKCNKALVNVSCWHYISAFVFETTKIQRIISSVKPLYNIIKTYSPPATSGSSNVVLIQQIYSEMQISDKLLSLLLKYLKYKFFIITTRMLI